MNPDYEDLDACYMDMLPSGVFVTQSTLCVELVEPIYCLQLIRRWAYEVCIIDGYESRSRNSHVMLAHICPQREVCSAVATRGANVCHAVCFGQMKQGQPRACCCQFWAISSPSAVAPELTGECSQQPAFPHLHAALPQPTYFEYIGDIGRKGTCCKPGMLGNSI